MGRGAERTAVWHMGVASGAAYPAAWEGGGGQLEQREEGLRKEGLSRNEIGECVTDDSRDASAGRPARAVACALQPAPLPPRSSRRCCLHAPARAFAPALQPALQPVRAPPHVPTLPIPVPFASLPSPSPNPSHAHTHTRTPPPLPPLPPFPPSPFSSTPLVVACA
eukprot:351735-Chlamydomonas_euryale.AAC.4